MYSGDENNSTLEHVFDVNSSPYLYLGGSHLNINLPNQLSVGTDYYITVDSGVLKNASGQIWEGVQDPTVWNFSTEPAFILAATSRYPHDNSQMVDIYSSISISFNQSILKGSSGNIRLYSGDANNSMRAQLHMDF